MDSKKPLYKFKTFWVLILFLLYSALGFFAVPYFIKKTLTQITIDELNSKISIENVSFNPFTIAADFNGIKVSDLDSTLWLSADKIHLNVNLWDTLFNHLNFDKLHISNPYYYLIRDNNSSTIVKYPKLVQTQESTDNSPFLLDIALIDINKGAVKFIDSTSEKQISLDLKQIRFHYDAFTTLDNNSQFSMSFVTAKDEKASFEGRFNLAKLSYDIQWSINDFTTGTVFHIIGDNKDTISGFNNKAGSFNANGTLMSQGEENKLPSLKVTSFELKDFSNGTTNDQQVSASLTNLTLNNTSVDLNQQSINIESVNSEAMDLSVSFDENNTLVLQVDNSQSAINETSNIWNYSIAEINVKNSVLNLKKINVNSTNSNELAFESIKISNLTNRENQTTHISLQSKIDSEGLIKVESQLKLNPLELKNTVNFDGIQLNKWQAWVPNNFQLEITDGLLSLDQDLIYKDNNLFSEGWFKINNLKLTDISNQPFFSINQLDLKQTTIDSSTKTISLGSIILDNAKGDLIVTEEQQLNITTISSKQSTEKNDTATKEEDWIIDIKEVEFIDAKTSLTDKSIKPNYQTELSKINGKIKGLSSSNLSKADVKLTGLIDTYGKLNIDGQINPLSESAFTDLSINIENLNLQNFSSYSGQFLGYPITRGKVDFKLKYKLNQSLLEGLNDLTYKQLQFGDKTTSQEAINLPIKLAVGLLTDGDGIMRINLPVSGNIDDPEFSYGGIVFKAFFKLITGIVASPFKLLGKLIPGGPDLDLSGIQFQAGTTILEDQEQVKLEAMKQILEQRPGILLELSGVVNTINDSKALKLQQLLAKLKQQEKPVFTTDYSITPLQSLYIQAFAEEKWQELITNATIEDVLNTVLLAENAWDKLLEHENIEGKLTTLAKDRALYIQSQLIETYAVSQDKIFIKPNEMSEELYPQVKFSVGQ